MAQTIRRGRDGAILAALEGTEGFPAADLVARKLGKQGLRFFPAELLASQPPNEAMYLWPKLGGRLVAAAEDWARQRVALEFASDCDLDNTLDNTVRQQTHKVLGFEETHRITHFRKPLAPPEEIARAAPGYRV